jgi:nitroimidazol reductase NimA-like FMN-containing flavoprotein (pyridoxamine 5'-phosphate oxidase superfamily)
VRRHPERASYEPATVRAILDEGLVCHLAFVDEGIPVVVPTMYGRHGDVLYIHGSPASRMLRLAADQAEVCLTVTLLDGLVMARAAFSHSMNFRSVVVLGRAREVTGAEEKMLASRVLVDHVCRGRWAEVRPPSERELATTLILKLGLEEAVAKTRTGPPKDQEADLALPVWAGELPLRSRPLEAVDAVREANALPVPEYLREYRRPGW